MKLALMCCTEGSPHSCRSLRPRWTAFLTILRDFLPSSQTIEQWAFNNLPNSFFNSLLATVVMTVPHEE
jgi:hypothetical protein